MNLRKLMKLNKVNFAYQNTRSDDNLLGKVLVCSF